MDKFKTCVEWPEMENTTLTSHELQGKLTTRNDNDDDDGDDDMYLYDDPPPVYDVAARLKEINAALAKECLPEDSEARHLRVTFRENPVELEVPAESHGSGSSDEDDGYGDSTETSEDMEETITNSSATEYEKSDCRVLVMAQAGTPENEWKKSPQKDVELCLCDNSANSDNRCARLSKDCPPSLAPQLDTNDVVGLASKLADELVLEVHLSNDPVILHQEETPASLTCSPDCQVMHREEDNTGSPQPAEDSISKFIINHENDNISSCVMSEEVSKEIEHEFHEKETTIFGVTDKEVNIVQENVRQEVLLSSGSDEPETLHVHKDDSTTEKHEDEVTQGCGNADEVFGQNDDDGDSSQPILANAVKNYLTAVGSMDLCSEDTSHKEAMTEASTSGNDKSDTSGSNKSDISGKSSVIRSIETRLLPSRPSANQAKLPVAWSRRSKDTSEETCTMVMASHGKFHIMDMADMSSCPSIPILTTPKQRPSKRTSSGLARLPCANALENSSMNTSRRAVSSASAHQHRDLRETYMQAMSTGTSKGCRHERKMTTGRPKTVNALGEQQSLGVAEVSRWLCGLPHNGCNRGGSYGLTDEQKEEKERRLLEVVKERQRKKASEAEMIQARRQRGETAFRQWLRLKKNQNPVASDKDLPKMESTPLKTDVQTNVSSVYIQDSMGTAFRDWLRRKREQKEAEKRLEELRLVEEQEMHCRKSRAENERAFKEWLQRKVKSQYARNPAGARKRLSLATGHRNGQGPVDSAVQSYGRRATFFIKRNSIGTTTFSS